MSHNRILYGLLLAVFVAAAILIVASKSQKNPLQKIQSFQDCSSAGYPVIQTYPRQCTLPNGKFFVEPQGVQECRMLADCPDGQACINHQCRKLTVP